MHAHAHLHTRLVDLALLTTILAAFGCAAPQQQPSAAKLADETSIDTTTVDDATTLASSYSIPPPASTQPPAPNDNWLVGDTTGPPRRVLEVAQQMLEDDVVIRGSCYRYISEVFERAGYGDRRSREVIYHGQRSGPFADLDLLQPGDWIFIVSYPDARPVGTHSLLFVGWADRDQAQARAISYAGGHSDRPADLITRDISRTYAIQRARERSSTRR